PHGLAFFRAAALTGSIDDVAHGPHLRGAEKVGNDNEHQTAPSTRQFKVDANHTFDPNRLTILNYRTPSPISDGFQSSLVQPVKSTASRDGDAFYPAIQPQRQCQQCFAFLALATAFEGITRVLHKKNLRSKIA